MPKHKPADRPSSLVGHRIMPRSTPSDGLGTDMESNKTLSSLFAEQQTNEIDWDGPLYSLYDLPTDASQLTIRFMSGKTRPPQGLRLKMRGGAMSVESTAAAEIVLWQDSAPEEVRIELTWKPKGKRSLCVWNAWRVKDVTQAWLGNAGMRVTAGEGRVFRLCCSDGEGDPDFTDLVVEVHVR